MGFPVMCVFYLMLHIIQAEFSACNALPGVSAVLGGWV